MTERFAIVLAGGGERVVAWEIGVLAGLADAGLDARQASLILGTSAGAYVAARLAAGEDPRAAADAIAAAPDHAATGGLGARALFEAFATAWEAAGDTLGERRRAIGRLALTAATGDAEQAIERLAGRLPGGTWPNALSIAAVDAHSGQRVTFHAACGVSIARAVAASRAVPTLLPPIVIAGRTYIDSALGSATNADVAASADASSVVIVTATPARAGTAGPDRLWLAALEHELRVLAAAGQRVTVVQAGAADLAAMGSDPMSAASARAAVAAGRTRGRALAAAAAAAA